MTKQKEIMRCNRKFSGLVLLMRKSSSQCPLATITLRVVPLCTDISVPHSFHCRNVSWKTRLLSTTCDSSILMSSVLLKYHTSIFKFWGQKEVTGGHISIKVLVRELDVSVGSTHMARRFSNTTSSVHGGCLRC